MHVCVSPFCLPSCALRGNLFLISSMLSAVFPARLLPVAEMAGANQGLLDIVEVSFLQELFLLSLGKERRKLRALCPAAENAGAAIIIKFCSLQVSIAFICGRVCCFCCNVFPCPDPKKRRGVAQAAGHGQNELLLALGRVSPNPLLALPVTSSLVARLWLRLHGRAPRLQRREHFIPEIRTSQGPEP